MYWSLFCEEEAEKAQQVTKLGSAKSRFLLFCRSATLSALHILQMFILVNTE